MDVAEALGSNAAQAMGFQLFAPVADNVSLGLPGASGARRTVVRVQLRACSVPLGVGSIISTAVARAV
jgi:hypothetical protein